MHCRNQRFRKSNPCRRRSHGHIAASIFSCICEGKGTEIDVDVDVRNDAEKIALGKIIQRSRLDVDGDGDDSADPLLRSMIVFFISRSAATFASPEFPAFAIGILRDDYFGVWARMYVKK